MDPAKGNPGSKRLTRRRVGLLALLAVLTVSALLALASPLLDRDSVASRRELASVDLGLPMTWLHQDRSAYSPPLPAHLGPASPWDDPTSVSFGPLLADIALVFLTLALIAGLLIAGFTQFRPSRRT